MRLRRLRVVDFAAIREANIEFGPGLNVLYGPNDLGKSTLVDAIRLVLLLIHSSSYCDSYVPWTGGQDPFVELTFETEAQRIYRVAKRFGKTGSSFLYESRDGVDFDEIAKGKKVDGKVRDLLRWGISEPGGAGAGKSLPTSFLATALLSTQADVTKVLNESLQDDPTRTGQERIAAALQAALQDPLFLAVLMDTQARRDEAYTDTGAKRKGKGSVFKIAADRLIDARNEAERLQQVVDESEGIETRLRELMATRTQREGALADATERLEKLEKLAAQAADVAVAVEHVRSAREEVGRIQKIGAGVTAADRNVKDLALKVEQAEQALKTALDQQRDAEAALKAAEQSAPEAGSSAESANNMARQRLELRRVTADQASKDAQQRIDGAVAAKKLVDAVSVGEAEVSQHQSNAERARRTLVDATAKEKNANEALQRVYLLEQAVEVSAADVRVTQAQADVQRETGLRARLESASSERESLSQQRASLTVPSPGELASIQHLDSDLKTARGVLDVGLVVTVTPRRALDVRVQQDATPGDPTSITSPLELEANTEVDIDIADIARVQVRGGRREAREKAVALEQRWNQEVAPRLAAAGVADIEALATRVATASELDAGIKSKDVELESLQGQLAPLSGAGDRLREASDHARACLTALGDVRPETLAGDIASLGKDPTTVLRERRQTLAKEASAARAKTAEANTALTLAEERARNAKATLDAAVIARDAAVVAFPEGIAGALPAAQRALADASAEQQKVASELASLEKAVAAERARVEASVRNAKAVAEGAKARVDAAQVVRTNAITERATTVGQLEQLRRQRDAEDLPAAESRLHDATQRHEALPVPERIVSNDEVEAARARMTKAKADLEAIQRDIHQAQGALQQVGGAVAREQLRDAREAFELAERYEKEIEEDYEAWKLLLEEMKEADKAQASNLGQTLAPVIATLFEELTQKRYAGIELTAHLGTEGVTVGGVVRPADRMSVGTREQFSTLYRLSLAQVLQTTVVLDDQLVQSDDTRMDWFRALLAEKARSFQIVVFTCRPGDYLTAGTMVPEGRVVYADTEDGLIRAVDLARAVQRY